MEYKQKGMFQKAAEDAAVLAKGYLTQGKDESLFHYPDYETYKSVQVQGNKQKIKAQFVKQFHIRCLADHLKAQLSEIAFGICHGTRSGREQKWFRQHLGDACNVIGTEISDTATEFANTVEWDFHEPRADWVGQASFVYSNSWDHAFDPQRAFSTWLGQLKPSGLLLLDHTKYQEPGRVDALDPFGVTFERLQALFKENFSSLGRELDPLDFLEADPRYKVKVFVFQKA